MHSGDAKIIEKVPFKLKLRAWWEGFDQEEYVALYSEQNEAQQAEDNDESKIDIKLTSDDQLFDTWDEDRIEIAKRIWGKGYCSPGSSEYVVSISKLLSLTPKMTMVQLGAGLGGPARTLAEKFGVWITGYECSPALVKAGNELSKLAGLTGKAELHHYEPETIKNFDRKFDRAFAKEALFAVHDKKRLLDLSYEWMKPEGLFLMTDYVLGSESVVGEAVYREWKEAEPSTPCPVTQEELVDLMQSAGFSVRVNEDISDNQCKLITQAWAGADAIVTGLMKQTSSDLVDKLVKEAEIWALRSKLLKSGSLKLVRILGYKNEEKSRMMSDW